MNLSNVKFFVLFQIFVGIFFLQSLTVKAASSHGKEELTLDSPDDTIKVSDEKKSSNSPTLNFNEPKELITKNLERVTAVEEKTKELEKLTQEIEKGSSDSKSLEELKKKASEIVQSLKDLKKDLTEDETFNGMWGGELSSSGEQVAIKLRDAEEKLKKFRKDFAKKQNELDQSTKNTAKAYKGGEDNTMDEYAQAEAASVHESMNKLLERTKKQNGKAERKELALELERLSAKIDELKKSHNDSDPSSELSKKIEAAEKAAKLISKNLDSIYQADPGDGTHQFKPDPVVTNDPKDALQNLVQDIGNFFSETADSLAARIPKFETAAPQTPAPMQKSLPNSHDGRDEEIYENPHLAEPQTSTPQSSKSASTPVQNNSGNENQDRGIESSTPHTRDIESPDSSESQMASSEPKEVPEQRRNFAPDTELVAHDPKGRTKSATTSTAQPEISNKANTIAQSSTIESKPTANPIRSPEVKPLEKTYTQTFNNYSTTNNTVAATPSNPTQNFAAPTPLPESGNGPQTMGPAYGNNNSTGGVSVRQDQFGNVERRNIAPIFADTKTPDNYWPAYSQSKPEKSMTAYNSQNASGFGSEIGQGSSEANVIKKIDDIISADKNQQLESLGLTALDVRQPDDVKSSETLDSKIVSAVAATGEKDSMPSAKGSFSDLGKLTEELGGKSAISTPFSSEELSDLTLRGVASTNAKAKKESLLPKKAPKKSVLRKPTTLTSSLKF